ncbi:MAG: hypothetical protein GY832_47395 [Chloroflexi bacterium]|nr:hypothetical protein [Chloroflexota bacterium]
MKLETLVFEKAGKHNTDATLYIAKERAAALGIKQIIVTSSHGYTARKAHAVFAPEGIKVIAIAGTGGGADTAIVCKLAYPRTFHKLEIRELLAKPCVP